MFPRLCRLIRAKVFELSITYAKSPRPRRLRTRSLLHGPCRALAQESAHSRADTADVPKKFVIFFWPQLDDHSYGKADFVVRVGHSIPCANRFQHRRCRAGLATATTSTCSPASSRPDHEEIRIIHKTPSLAARVESRRPVPVNPDSCCQCSWRALLSSGTARPGCRVAPSGPGPLPAKQARARTDDRALHGRGRYP
jgi:hypothetical protein